MTDGSGRGGPAPRSPAVRAPVVPGRDLAILASLLIVAAVLRLPDLLTRATWDADQGHDMSVLRSLVRDGVVPLLGPPTSIGDFHHGAAYYFALSPAAWLTGGDSPLAVLALIALFGIVAVAVTWWLARSIGGPVAGAVAGLVMAVSATSVDESTFIWNPNLIALTSGLALAGGWAAWHHRRPAWWLLAGLGTGLTMQCHVLGVVLLPIVAALFVADLRRSDGPGRGRLWRMGLGALAIIAVMYLPLVIHELQTGGAELQALRVYLGGDGRVETTTGIPTRIAVVLLRVVGWPLAGLITDRPLVVMLASVLVGAIVVWRWRSPVDAVERTAVRWLGLGLAWSALSLAVLAPSLASVVAGLPNDHYHAFADPMVFVIVGLGAAGVWRSGGGVARTVAVIAVGVVVALNLAWQPPRIAPGGSFPDLEAAAARIDAIAKGRAVDLRSVPDFKSPEALAYPLVRSGVVLGDPAATPLVIVLCDPLFEPTVGAACGGAAEDASVQEALDAGELRLVERFDATPRQRISIYERP